jgi:agmatine deiminase
MRAPGLDGFAMPAEWAPHRATWLAWPHERTDWPGKFTPIPWVYGEIVRVLSQHERVAILVQNAAEEQRARLVLKKAGADLEEVDFYRFPTDRSWVRDSGPIFVTNKQNEKVATRWKFNAWAKYPNHKRDARVASRIANAAAVREYQVAVDGKEVVLEGGAIDVDGTGNLIATEECLLSDVQARNPELGREDIEKILWEVLGARRVIWLGRGIAGDDTHGHIDDVARFIAPGVVLLCEEKNPRDENYPVLEENRERLESAEMEVVRLPMPAPLVFSGQRLPASYANFYIANDVVMVPTFNDGNDRRALGTIAEFFPERKVVGIHCVDLVWGLGTLHCATQQEPA